MDVSRRFRKGVVIAADTLVSDDKNKIVGKPRSKEDAKRALKYLAKKPQWVYTGLAVIDIDGYHDKSHEVERIKSSLDYRHQWLYDYLGGEYGEEKE